MTADGTMLLAATSAAGDMGPVEFAICVVVGLGLAVLLGLRRDRRRGYRTDDPNRPIFRKSDKQDGH